MDFEELKGSFILVGIAALLFVGWLGASWLFGLWPFA